MGSIKLALLNIKKNIKNEKELKSSFIISVVGMIGIRPTIEAVKAKKIVCLANKESLVCAGDIIMPLAKKNKVEEFIKNYQELLKRLIILEQKRSRIIKPYQKAYNDFIFL